MQALLGFAFAAGAESATASDYLFGDGFEPGPILWYRFEGDTTNTGSLSGYALTFSNASFDAGKVGQAISFGSNGYAFVAGMKSVLGALPLVTVGFWNYESAAANRNYWDVSNRFAAPYGGISFFELTSPTNIGVCVSNAIAAYVTGSCPVIAAPSSGAWHHWIISNVGSGPGSGAGGEVNIYLDDVLALTIDNLSFSDPVFNSGISDTLYIGGNGSLMDDLRIYDRVFTPEEQCARIIGGAWTGSNCTLP